MIFIRITKRIYVMSSDDIDPPPLKLMGYFG